MRGDLVNLNVLAINEQSSGLIMKCLEISHYAYYQRWHSFPTSDEPINFYR